MKRRYFIATMTVFLGVFLLAYLLLEILFMIFEAEPYTKLLVLFVLLVTDFVATDHIINQVLRDRWLREAPDILDAIKTPEPAYIPEGPADTEPESAKTQNKKEVRRFHRTQYKELAAESQAINQDKKTEPEAEKEIKQNAEQKDAAASLTASNEAKPSGKEKKKRRWLRREKKSVPAAEEPKQPAAAPAVRSWTPDLDDMDTVEFEDAVINLEQRVRKSETKHTEQGPSDNTVHADKPERPQQHPDQKTDRRTAGPEKPAERKKRKRKRSKKPQNTEVQKTEQRKEEAPKSASWAGTLDEMDTVEISKAIRNISSAESADAGDIRKQRQRKRSSGN